MWASNACFLFDLLTCVGSIRVQINAVKSCRGAGLVGATKQERARFAGWANVLGAFGSDIGGCSLPPVGVLLDHPQAQQRASGHVRPAGESSDE